jgi:hypothetical protein
MSREKWLIITGLGIAAVGVFLYMRKRRGQVYGAGEQKFEVVLAPYNGKYKDEPAIKEFQRDFNRMVNKAVRTIKTDPKTRHLKQPPVKVTIELDDSFDSDPYMLPSAATTCSKIPYDESRGNCASYGFKMGSKAIAERYKGRSRPEKFLTHELTHIFMLYNIPNHDQLPEHIIEGIPIHVADQQDEIKAVQNDPNIKKQGNFGYKPGEIHVDKYGEIIDEYQRQYGD